ncbi:MAG: nucleotidyl transferase AbiEii/AbiGii toxin family protein [Thermodesulfobacteriota bacterium]
MVRIIRKATDEEKRYYADRLYPLQDSLFGLLSDFWGAGFYLTGGTALSRFYYDHRFSDDLDLFFDGAEYDESRFRVMGTKLVDRIHREHGLEVTIESEFFKRMFVTGSVPMKIELVFEPYRRAGEFTRVRGICLDSKENMAANKISAISGRKMAKDFFDLYYLLREIPFADAVAFAAHKHVPLDYEGIILAVGDILSSISPLEGEVLTTGDVDHEEFEAFVRSLVGKLIDDARHR